MIRRYIKEAVLRREHSSWVIAQHVFVRGLLALKLFLAARALGPEQIGLIGVVLLSLAIVESLSDTGLSQAIVQRTEIINTLEAGAVWTLLLGRGLLLSFLLLVAAIPISIFFDINNAAPLVAVAALIPLLRNAINPGFFLVQRACNFRYISIYESAAAIVDLAVTMLMIHFNFLAVSLLIGNIAGESLKLLLTWSWFRIAIRPNWNWSHLKSLTSFGKWIWGSSLLTLALNQLDKILVVKFLGPAEFGLYQIASRIAQLTVADGASALAQYLYPTFSQRYRSSPRDARRYFNWIAWRFIPLVACVGIALGILAQDVVGFFLGVEWLSSVSVLRAMIVPMFLGAVITVLAAYLRAVGEPAFVTQSALIQLLFLLATAPILLHYFGAVGIAISLMVAAASAVYYMFYKIVRKV